jgi:anti-anti-sigma factor
MPIDFEDSANEIRHIKISGRLDILGSGEIDAKFAALAATEKRHVVVDLTAITFLASIGIRSIISNAKAQHQRGGKMVLFVGENASVAKTLEMTGIDTLVPMFKDMLDAEKAVFE